MAFEYKRVDVDSHCQEKPDTWTSRMSKPKWGDRIPQIHEKDGREIWLCDGKVMMNGWLALCHGVIPDRKSLPTHWRDVPSMIYTADGRMRAMDRDGVSAQALFPNTAGVGGEGFMMTIPCTPPVHFSSRWYFSSCGIATPRAKVASAR